MKHKHDTGANRGLGGRIAAALVGAVCALCVSATPALAAEASITNTRTKATYENLATATAEAQSGDTIKLGEGNYTLYGVSSVGHTKGKDLTFVGSGTDKTAWNIGAKVPPPDYFGTEYNGDYSFDGAGTVTFKNMTLRSGTANYLGFIRANRTVTDSCVINGKTFYWGYDSAVFKNTTFKAPNGDYAIWTYSSPVMTFESCTFNASGKVINVYTDAGAGKRDITVNVSNCTFNSSAGWFSKQALSINDSNMGNYKYILNITNSSATAKRDNTTCSQLFGFGGKSGNNTGRTDVTIDGTKVWSNKTMLTHSYTDGQHNDNFVDLKDYKWEQKDGDWYCTGHAKCGYCGYKIAETVKASVETAPATCTEAGKTTYTATFTHKCFKPQTKSEGIAALNHDWGEPEYSWAKQDDGWYCTAKRTCKRDASHVEQQTVKASVETTPATCTEAGKDVYTATFDGDVFESQTRDDVLPALNHDWGEPEYSWAKQDDGWYCTAKRTCKRDASHVEEETVKAAYEVTTPATTEKDGEGIYTATFENEAFETQTKAEAIAKLPATPNKPGKADVKPAQNKVTPATPQTGDQTNLAIPVAIAVIGIVVVAGAVIIRRRNK